MGRAALWAALLFAFWVAPSAGLAQTGAPASHPLVGTWLTRSQEGEVLARFDPDGRCQRVVSLPGQAPRRETGRYQLAAADILFLRLDDGSTIRLHCRFVNPDTLRLTDDEGNGLEMVRQAGPPASAPTSGWPPVTSPAPGNWPAPPPGSSQPPAGSWPPPAPSAGQPAAPVPLTMVFKPAVEPREQAFRLLIPKGWLTSGGVVRVDPNATGGPGNSLAAKVDFAVLRDQAGGVMIRWLPSMNYLDPNRSAVPGVPLPQGGTRNGLLLAPMLPALAFMQQKALPYAHPQATGWRVLEQKPLPRLVQLCQQIQAANGTGLRFGYDAALVRVTYQEGGVGYEERMLTVIEDMGPLGAGMWSNKETVFIRAPLGELANWEGVLRQVQESVKFNPQWLAGELAGQRTRGRNALEHQREMQRLAREIVEHKHRTYQEIRNDMYLTLTNQEEYVNPYTREVETGSNQWQRRWVNQSGEVVYSNDPNYDPNRDPNLRRTDYQPTPVRPRFPQ